MEKSRTEEQASGAIESQNLSSLWIKVVEISAPSHHATLRVECEIFSHSDAAANDKNYFEKIPIDLSVWFGAGGKKKERG